MTRQEKLNKIGKLKPSKFEPTNTLNHMSYFIIPIPHKVYQSNANKFFDGVEKSKWEILNKQDRVFQTNDIKKYIYDNMIPKFDEKNKKEFIFEKRNIVLSKKLKENSFTFQNHQIFINEVDLWIMDEFISFFVVKVELPIDSEMNVTQISSILNRNFRDFRSLNIENNEFSIKRDNGNFIDWLLGMTKVDNNSFLNIKKEDFENTELYPIYNSSYYSKMITAIQIDTDTIKDNNDNEVAIEGSFEEELKFIEIDGTSTLDEMPYYLATTSDIYPDRLFEASEAYIYSLMNEGGISLWKYWSGVAIEDSLAFFSLKSGGSGIVNSARNNVYFIYMLNLYINYQLRYLEHTLIDKDFINIDNIYPKIMELQRLNNQFIGSEIAIKFQPNEIHQAISKALQTKEMFEEIENNIAKTYELTKDNTNIIITIFMGFATFIGAFLSKDKIISFYDKHTNTAITITIFVILFVIIGIVKRKSVMSFINKIFNKISYLMPS